MLQHKLPEQKLGYLYVQVTLSYIRKWAKYYDQFSNLNVRSPYLIVTTSKVLAVYHWTGSSTLCFISMIVSIDRGSNC